MINDKILCNRSKTCEGFKMCYNISSYFYAYLNDILEIGDKQLKFRVIIQKRAQIRKSDIMFGFFMNALVKNRR